MPLNPNDKVSSMTPKELIDATVAPLASFLLENAFKKSGRRFHKDIGEARVFIAIQASQWNREENASFSINLAIYAPFILRKLGLEVSSFPRSEKGCTWHEDLGNLTPEKLHLSWKLVGKESIEDISLRLVEMVRLYAVPWFETVTTYDGFCRMLSQSTGVGPANMLWSLGFLTEATGCIDRMPKNTSGRVQAAAEWYKSHEHKV